MAPTKRHIQKRLFPGEAGFEVEVKKKKAVSKPSPKKRKPRRSTRRPGERSMKKFGAEIPTLSKEGKQYIHSYRLRKKAERDRVALEKDLTALTRQGKAGRFILGEGRKYRVYEIIGSRGKGVAKKRKIPVSFEGHEELLKKHPEEYYDRLIDIKLRSMTDAEYRQAVELAKEAIEHHKHAEQALEGRVPALYGVQMRAERPTYFVLQERVPVIIKKHKFEYGSEKTKRGRTVETHRLTGSKPVSPKFMEMVLPDIIRQLTLAEKGGYPMDSHLSNWLVVIPRNKTPKKVVNEWEKTKSRNFAVLHCDTLHEWKKDSIPITASFPQLMASIKRSYPRHYYRLRDLAIDSLRNDVGKKEAEEIRELVVEKDEGILRARSRFVVGLPKWALGRKKRR